MNLLPTYESVLSPAGRQKFSQTMRFGLLANHPPTRNALARFSAGLAVGLGVHESELSVVHTAENPRAQCSEALNRCDVALIQFDDGVDCDEVLDIGERLQVPAIVVVHDVAPSPTRQQRETFAAVAAMAARFVATSESARQRLCAVYGVDRRDVVVIPHGATVPTLPRMKRPSRPTILTWGLLGPGKGIERVIDAMTGLGDVAGRPRYLVVGPTRPSVYTAEGDAYRDALIERARSIGVADSVSFDPRHYDGEALMALIQSAAVVVLPYDSTDKVCSGVLVEAIVSGRPVVATAFPHATELLSSGAGTVVDHGDPAALRSALRRILTQPRLAGAMAGEARQMAPRMAWPVVARGYIDLAHRVLVERRAVR